MVAFATPAELASHLQQDLDTASATQALTLASALVRATVGQAITADDIVAVLYPVDREPWLELPQWPATAVTAVTVDGVAVTDYTATTTHLWRRSGWGRCDGRPVPVTVAYTAGYATTPDDVKAACLFVAGQVYGNPEALESVAIDDYRSTRLPGGSLLPQSLADQLRATYGGGAYVTGSR